RVTLGARVKTGLDGLKRIELVTAEAVDQVTSTGAQFDLPELRRQLIDAVAHAAVVPARPAERKSAERIVDAFLDGLGSDTKEILSAYQSRATAGLIDLINKEHRKFTTKPVYDEVIEVIPFAPTRQGRAEISSDRFSGFKRNIGYAGYGKAY